MVEHKGPLFPLKIELNAQSFRDAGIPLDEALVLDERISQAALTFSQIIWKRYEQGSKAILPATPATKLVDVAKLGTIWASWRAQKEIAAIHKITMNEGLAALLSSVMKITPFKITPISPN